MNTTNEQHQSSRSVALPPNAISLQPWVAIAGLTICALTLFGWSSHNTTFLPGNPPVDPSSTIAMGLALIGAVAVRTHQMKIGRLLGCLVIAIGAEGIASTILEKPILLERFWPEEARSLFKYGSPGFVPAALCVGIGIALLLSTARKLSLIDLAGVFSIGIISLATVRLISLALDFTQIPIKIRSLYPALGGVASLLFLLACFGLLDARPDSSISQSMYRLPPETSKASQKILYLVLISLFFLVVVDIDASNAGANWSIALLLLAWLFWGGVAVTSSGQIIKIEHQRASAVEALTASEQRFRRLADHAPDVIIRFGSRPTRIIYANSRIQDLTGYSPDAFVADPGLWRKLIVAEDRVRLPMWNTNLSEAPIIVRVRNRTGVVHWIEARLSALAEDADGSTGVDAVIRDITDSKRAEANLTRRAYLDPVTNLANRNAVEEQLGYLVETFRHPARSDLDEVFAVVLFLDLDGFKAINDRLGHDAGDHILMLVGERLRASVKDDDMVARFGGDEFVVILDGIRSRDQANSIAARILLSLRSPFVIGDLQLQVTTSIGATQFDRSDPKDPGTLLREADRALYLAKGSGKDRIWWFDGVQVDPLSVESPQPSEQTDSATPPDSSATDTRVPSNDIDPSILANLPRSGHIAPEE